jgi:hypothetical protein
MEKKFKPRPEPVSLEKVRASKKKKGRPLGKNVGLNNEMVYERYRDAIDEMGGIRKKGDTAKLANILDITYIVAWRYLKFHPELKSPPNEFKEKSIGEKIDFWSREIRSLESSCRTFELKGGVDMDVPKTEVVFSIQSRIEMFKKFRDKYIRESMIGTQRLEDSFSVIRDRGIPRRSFAKKHSRTDNTPRMSKEDERMLRWASV